MNAPEITELFDFMSAQRLAIDIQKTSSTVAMTDIKDEEHRSAIRHYGHPLWRGRIGKTSPWIYEGDPLALLRKMFSSFSA